MTEHEPPSAVVDFALREARQSHCGKSNRGAAVYLKRADSAARPGPAEIVIGRGYNGPPGEVTCDDSEACRASCSKRCLHAESRALRAAARYWPDGMAQSCDLVHVKLGPDDGLTAGGPPSCWQCSREILDVGLGGVWLYEAASPSATDAWDRWYQDAMGKTDAEYPAWRRYTAAEFHRVTCVNAGVY